MKTKVFFIFIVVFFVSFYSKKQTRIKTAKEKLEIQKMFIINNYKHLNLICTENYFFLNNKTWNQYKKTRDSLFCIFKKNFPEKFKELESESDFFRYKPISKKDSNLIIKLRLNLIKYEERSSLHLDSLFYNWEKNKKQLEFKLDSVDNNFVDPLAFNR